MSLSSIQRSQFGFMINKTSKKSEETTSTESEKTVEVVRIILNKEDIKQFPQNVQNKISKLNPKFIEYIENFGGFTINEEGKVIQEIALKCLSSEEKKKALLDKANVKYCVYSVPVYETPKSPTSSSSKSAETNKTPSTASVSSSLPKRGNVNFNKDLGVNYSDKTLSTINSEMLLTKIKYSQSVENNRGEYDVLTLNQHLNFISNVTEDQSEQILKSMKGSNFLIRPSRSEPEALAISIKLQGSEFQSVRLSKSSNETYLYEEVEYKLLNLIKHIITVVSADGIILTFKQFNHSENVITREPSLKNCTVKHAMNFVSNVTESQSEQILRSVSGPKFLIRPSSSTPNALTASIQNQDLPIHHVKLLKNPEKETYVYRKVEYTFLDLIEYIKTTTECDFIDVIGFQPITYT